MLHTLHPQQWVDNYADSLYAFAKARVSSADVAKDIVQETFLSAWKARDGYRGDASEKNWLFTICRNKITDHYRKASTQLEDLSVDDDNSHFEDSGHWNMTNNTGRWDAAAQVDSKEFYKILNACKDNLKELQKAVFVMKYLDDMDTEEICKELNISSSNYWVLMHRAKLQLRDCLGKNWFNNK